MNLPWIMIIMNYWLHHLIYEQHWCSSNSDKFFFYMRPLSSRSKYYLIVIMFDAVIFGWVSNFQIKKAFQNFLLKSCWIDNISYFCRWWILNISTYNGHNYVWIGRMRNRPGHGDNYSTLTFGNFFSNLLHYRVSWTYNWSLNVNSLGELRSFSNSAGALYSVLLVVYCHFLFALCLFEDMEVFKCLLLFHCLSFVSIRSLSCLMFFFFPTTTDLYILSNPLEKNLISPMI